ncbi:hypothetical protein [Rhodococcus pyridinivorans]|uniref:hypothetical protein n=1 Tax=Rhodococcus pyridinivorans TaxID=103816 RepID=UPI0039B6CEE9
MSNFADEPVWRLVAPPEYAQNPHILAWWGPEHDEVVVKAIAEHAWHYPWKIDDELAAITAEEDLSTWRSSDPVCSDYRWEGVLQYFAVARAQSLGLERGMRKARVRKCLRCKSKFREDSLPVWAYERLGGIAFLKYCLPCCKECFFENDLNDDRYSDAEIVEYIIELTESLQAVPSQNLFDKNDCLAGRSDMERTAILNLSARRPTAQRVKKSFGSWLGALIAAGVLPDGSHRTARGIRTIAADGHVCLSIAEKIIDDWLTSYGIDHTKEPRYPNSKFRADFEVDGKFIEFFGLAGNPDYDARIAEKRTLAEREGIDLIEIYPNDVVAWNKTQFVVAGRLGMDLANRPRRALSSSPAKEVSAKKPAPPEGPIEVQADPGWYFDPTQREAERRWDGRYWTHEARDSSGYEYSDTPYDGTVPPNRGPNVDGKPSYEIASDKEAMKSLHMLYRWMDATENEARRMRQQLGIGFVAPAPYAAAANFFQKLRNRPAELAVLDRFADQEHGAGAVPPKLLKRREGLRNAGYHYDPIQANMFGADLPRPAEPKTRT